jgi:triphosphoribosyl-dephospho-CoA synthetase
MQQSVTLELGEPDFKTDEEFAERVAERERHRLECLYELDRRFGEQGVPDALEKLDDFLRADGNRRNPGTSADLTAATLFVALREGIIAPPFGPIR